MRPIKLSCTVTRNWVNVRLHERESFEVPRSLVNVHLVEVLRKLMDPIIVE